MRTSMSISSNEFKLSINDLEYEDCKLMKAALAHTWLRGFPEQERRIERIIKKLEMLGVE